MNGSRCPDSTDLLLLSILQEEIPLTSRPFDAIAARAGIGPAETLRRIQRLQEAGIIRSLSPVLESRRLGIGAATLVALRVPEERISAVAGIVSSFAEVSHNYRRDHPYAIWFTLAAGTPDELGRVLRTIRERTGVPEEDVLELPTVRQLKIDLRFPFPVTSRPEEARHGC